MLKYKGTLDLSTEEWYFDQSFVSLLATKPSRWLESAVLCCNGSDQHHNIPYSSKVLNWGF